MAEDTQSRSPRIGPCIFSVDVEDWFHILDVASTPEVCQWDQLPSRVEVNFQRLLDIFDLHNVQVTCFFLAWVAQRFPHLVREARMRGHEIASHGFAHKLTYKMTQQEFLEDAVTSKAILEDTAGCEVIGYRAAGFSATKETPWFFDQLLSAGYRYDSSVFPASHGHRGWKGSAYAPYLAAGGPRDGLIEVPMTVANVASNPVCFFGGGYLRLFPMAMIRSMARKVLQQDRPVIFYIHPRELDPYHPRLGMNMTRTLRSYINLKTTEAKVRKILGEFEVTTFQQFLAEHPVESTTIAPRAVAAASAGQVGPGVR